MTYPVSAPADEADALAAELVTEQLRLPLSYAGRSFELEPHFPNRGWRLHLTPTPTLPWSQGDVQGNLNRNGVIATVARVEQPLPCPGPDLVLTLPSSQDVRALGRLVETGLTPLQNGALQLNRAFGSAGLSRRVTVEDGRIEVEGFTPDDALRLFRRFGGDALDLHGIDMDDWADHQIFAARFQEVVRTATERELLVESEPVCRPCRPTRGRNRVQFDLLDAADALALSAALKKPAMPAVPLSRIA